MLLRRIARPLIAGVFISEGLAIARDPESKVEAAAPVLAALKAVSYTHLRAHETVLDLVCRLLLEKKKTSIT